MLIEATDADFAALIEGGKAAEYAITDGGIESAEVLGMLRDLARNIRSEFTPAAWMIVEDSVVIGLCSLLCAPDKAGVISIGYVLPPGTKGAA
jgi:hypothetical protein